MPMLRVYLKRHSPELDPHRAGLVSVQALLRVDRQEAASTKRPESVIFNYGFGIDLRSLSPEGAKSQPT